MLHTKKLTLAVAAAAGSMGAVPQAQAVSPYFQSFNSGIGDWQPYAAGSIVDVADGGGQLQLTHSVNYTNQFVVPNGPPDAPGGVFTDLGKYMEATNVPGIYQPPSGPGGFGAAGLSTLGGDGTNDAVYRGDYFNAIDVYVDLERWTIGRPGVPIFWLDTAARLTDGSLAAPGTETSWQFNRATSTSPIVVAGPGSGTTPGNVANPVTITQTGWYTFVAVYMKGTTNRAANTTNFNFRVESDYYIIDSAGNQIGAISHMVGIPRSSQLGNGGYQWITVWSNDDVQTIGFDNSRSDVGRLLGGLPEPSSIGLLAFGGVAWLRRRRH